MNDLRVISHQQKKRNFKRNILIGAISLVSIIHIGVNFLSEIRFEITIISWLISTIGVIIIIQISNLRNLKLQEELQKQIYNQEKRSQRQTALAKLSTRLATSLSEKEIYREVVQHLNVVQGYDHVAIFLKEKDSDNRILGSYVGGFDFQDTVSIPPNMGVSGKPLLTGKLQYTPDVSKNSNYIPGLGQGSEIDVPIIFDEEIFGVIVVENHHIEAFTQNDFTMLSTASDQAALAINNTRLLESEKKRRREAEILRNAANAVNSDLELPVLLDRILTQLSEVVPYDSASIFLQEEDYLYAKAVRGLPFPEEVLGNQFPADDPLFQMVLGSKEPIIIGNIHESAIFQGWGGTEVMSSWMGIPLQVGLDILGILTIDHKEINAYNKETMEFARIFANQAAVALQNAQLYQSAKNSADLLMILHQASQKITGASFDPERTYSTIHEAACQLMPCEAFSISILDESKKEIEAVYLYDREGRSPSVRIPASQGLSGHIIASGKPLLIHDYLESEQMQEIHVIHFGHSDHIRAFIAVPMILGNKVVGMLSSQSYLPHKYTTQDRQMLEVLAAHAAVAIDNSHLFAQIQQLAITDSLTGVYNRRYFFDAAQLEFHRSTRYRRPLSIIMVDLDNYKTINDVHGHLIGDLALKDFSKLLTDHIRETDILGRYGGDEFSILLPETDKNQAMEIAERLKELVSKTQIIIDQTRFYTTISVGVSSINDRVTNFSQLLLSADMALYDAKKGGRNRVCFREWPIQDEDSEM